MRAVTFASGSGGNCALVSDGDIHILVDAGISMRRIRAGLSFCNLRPEDLTAVLLTHEHSDHVSGLPVLAKSCDIPIFAPRAVAGALRRMAAGVEKCLYTLSPHTPFSLGGVSVTAFRTPHDASESVGYRFDGRSALGFCTDLGHVTDEVRDALSGCDAAVLESNHDEEMLRYGPYPVYLKRRILSSRGHLSNGSCGELSVSLAAGGTRRIVLGHLSRENNRPELALQTVRRALDEAGYPAVALAVAPPSSPCVLEVSCAPAAAEAGLLRA